GVLAEACRETQDSVEADTTQPGGGAAAGALGEVLGDGHEFVLAAAQAEQGSVSPFREVLAAGATAQAADTLAAVGPAMRMQVADATLAVGRTVRVGAGQLREVLGAHRFTLFSTGYYHFIQHRAKRDGLRRHHQMTQEEVVMNIQLTPQQQQALDAHG